MIAKNIRNAVENFDKTCDDVIQNCEPLIITRDNGANVVLISQTEYDHLWENLYLCQNEANYAHLLKSMAEAEAGRLTFLDPHKQLWLNVLQTKHGMITFIGLHKIRKSQNVFSSF